VGGRGRGIGLDLFLVISLMMGWSLSYFVVNGAPKTEINRRTNLSMMDGSINPIHSLEHIQNFGTKGRPPNPISAQSEYQTLR